jgi:hypothetical protein
MTLLVILFAAILVAAVAWVSKAMREQRATGIPRDTTGADALLFVDPGTTLEAPHHHGGCDSGGHDAGGIDSGCHSGFDGGHHG